MLNWRILVQGKMDPAYNMALDEAILLNVEKGLSMPTIRFYDWNPPTVSYGYHQDVHKEIDTEAVKAMQYGLIRRPTGGRVVLHKDEVTYSVIAPLADHLRGSILDVYSEISHALSAGLLKLGIAVEFEKGNLPVQHQRDVSNPCFSSSSRYELVYEGKKIVGSAQVRKESAFLQHGSILLAENQSSVAQFIPNLTLEKREKLAVYLAYKTVCIQEIVNATISFEQVVTALIAGFKEAWTQDGFSVSYDIESFEKEYVSDLLHSKYLQNHWIDRSLKKDLLNKNNLT